MVEGEFSPDGLPEESRPKGELEEVSAKEYEEALDVLEDFKEDDISDLEQLADLEQAMAGVGKAMDASIRTNGQIENVTTPDGKTETRRVLKQTLLSEDMMDHREITGALGDGIVTISVTENDRDKYKIEVPLRDSFHNGRVDYTATEYGVATADEEPHTVVYAPTKQFTVPEAQQGYARVLQLAAADVSAVSKEPASDPLYGVIDPFKNK